MIEPQRHLVVCRKLFYSIVLSRCWFRWRPLRALLTLLTNAAYNPAPFRPHSAFVISVRSVPIGWTLIFGCDATLE